MLCVQIDGVRNPKMQSVFLDDMPIHRAAFASGGSQVRSFVQMACLGGAMMWSRHSTSEALCWSPAARFGSDVIVWSLCCPPCAPTLASA
jgi:hypothetical protein